MYFTLAFDVLYTRYDLRPTGLSISLAYLKGVTQQLSDENFIPSR
jgi:hypothetical protein